MIRMQYQIGWVNLLMNDLTELGTVGRNPKAAMRSVDNVTGHHSQLYNKHTGSPSINDG